MRFAPTTELCPNDLDKPKTPDKSNDLDKPKNLEKANDLEKPRKEVQTFFWLSKQPWVNVRSRARDRNVGSQLAISLPSSLITIPPLRG